MDTDNLMAGFQAAHEGTNIVEQMVVKKRGRPKVQKTTELDMPELSDIRVESEVIVEDLESVPMMSSPQWHDYVMSHFSEEEVYDGNPTTDGLRRVTELLLGPIIRSHSKSVMTPHAGNGDSATVEHTVDIDFQIQPDFKGMRSFCDLADVSPRNTKDPLYSKFASATAATKAEGRALRKALKLRRVTAAEELDNLAEIDTMSKGYINTTQINGIDRICKRNNINVIKVVEEFMTNHDVKKFDKLSHELAVSLVGRINKLQQQDPMEEQYAGYDEGWREKI